MVAIDGLSRHQLRRAPHLLHGHDVQIRPIQPVPEPPPMGGPDAIHIEGGDAHQHHPDGTRATDTEEGVMVPDRTQV